MKNLLVALLMLPALSWAIPGLEGTCKDYYEHSYNLMAKRQSGVPMHVIVDDLNKHTYETEGILTAEAHKNHDKAKEFLMSAIELAYTMPYVGFFADASHQMGVEFANRQYMKCMRLGR